jgi:hypothetical protein
MPAAPTTRPLGLSDQQFTTLINAADHVCWRDRGAFLRSVAHRFAGRNSIGDGEFSRGLRELLRSGFFKPPTLTGAQPRDRSSRLRDRPAIE